MTEITIETGSMPPAVARFVLHWGDLGGQWGVNRSVAQMHALLYLADAPMHAEEIAAQLGLARSNVSNSLKELLIWKLIRRVPIMNDRRDHYEAETDLWEIAMRIAQGRKEREIDPADAALQACVRDAEADNLMNPVALARLRAMLEFTQAINQFYDQMLGVPKSTLSRLMKLGAGITRLLVPGKKNRSL
jgi:DNA-binding transcriptional regulator GbsR (MarR family)